MARPTHFFVFPLRSPRTLWWILFASLWFES